MEGIGRGCRSSGRIYLVGGSCAVLVGWRATTVDVDLKLDPEPAGAFEAIAGLKDTLGVNVELAAPDQFIPPLPGWRERSPFVVRHGGGLIEPATLRRLFNAIEAALVRYPSLDPGSFRGKVERAIAELDG